MNTTTNTVMNDILVKLTQLCVTTELANPFLVVVRTLKCCARHTSNCTTDVRIRLATRFERLLSSSQGDSDLCSIER